MTDEHDDVRAVDLLKFELQLICPDMCELKPHTPNHHLAADSGLSKAHGSVQPVSGLREQA